MIPILARFAFILAVAITAGFVAAALLANGGAP